MIKKVAVLLGGKSGEREVSLRSGKGVLDALDRLGVSAVAIDPICENWINEVITEKIDLVFLALHGKGYEDGTIQGVLETLEIPYTGSGVLASAIAMNKIIAKRVFTACGVPTPKFVIYDPSLPIADQCENAISKLGLPIVVKPSSEGSSLGVSIVEEKWELRRVIEKTAIEFGEIFFEQFICGQEITVGILEIGSDLRALPVLELVPKREFYDYEAKYTKGMTDFIIPARLSDDLTEKVQSIAISTHKVINCHGYSRVDMRVDENGQPFVTEVNTLPGLTDLSDLPAQAKAADISYDRLILEILKTAK